jgi:hypothetical protein
MRPQDYMRDIASLGCIVCHKFLHMFSPADAHHILRGGRKIDDYHTIPLCYAHHRSGNKNEDYVSRHPWHTEFEKRYGSEWDLLALTKQRYAEEFAP